MFGMDQRTTVSYRDVITLAIATQMSIDSISLILMTIVAVVL